MNLFSSKSKRKRSSEVDESLLEMYFFPAIVEHFRLRYGAKFLRLLKPSRQTEAWLGFDQAWTFSTVSRSDFEASLKDAIASNKTSVPGFFIGFFLQFKVVEELVNESQYKPKKFSTPYFRSELDLKPNKTTSISQHQTLIRLQKIANAHVSYACPMFFDPDEVYAPPSLTDLRCVPLTTAPSGWSKDERHFLCFRTPNDPKPVWCSEPVDAVSLSFAEWASPDSRHDPKPMSSQEIIELVEAARFGRDGSKRSEKKGLLPESLTIIEFE